MLYTKEQIITEAGLYGSGVDPYNDDGLMADSYIRMTVSIASLKVDADFVLSLDTWDSYTSCFIINGESWIDEFGKQIIRNLMKRYTNGEEVFPIIVDKDFNIQDGSHRLAALNTLGITSTEIYYPV